MTALRRGTLPPIAQRARRRANSQSASFRPEAIRCGQKRRENCSSPALSACRAKSPARWNWADLHQRTLLDAAGLKMLGIIWHPAVLQILGEPNSKTALSIVTTFRAHLAPIEALADAWGNADKTGFQFQALALRRQDAPPGDPATRWPLSAADAGVDVRH